MPVHLLDDRRNAQHDVVQRAANLADAAAIAHAALAGENRRGAIAVFPGIGPADRVEGEALPLAHADVRQPLARQVDVVEPPGVAFLVRAGRKEGRKGIEQVARLRLVPGDKLKELQFVDADAHVVLKPAIGKIRAPIGDLLDGKPRARADRDGIVVALRLKARVREHIAHGHMCADAGHRPVERVFALHTLDIFGQHITRLAVKVDARPGSALDVDVDDRARLDHAQRGRILAAPLVHGHAGADDTVVFGGLLCLLRVRLLRRRLLRAYRRRRAQRQQRGEHQRAHARALAAHQLALYTRTVSTPPSAWSAKRTS